MLKSENKTTGDRLSIIPSMAAELNAELAGTGRFVDANDHLHLVRQAAAEEVQLMQGQPAVGPKPKKLVLTALLA